MAEGFPLSFDACTAIIVIIDPTNKKQIWPTANPILKLYTLERFPNAECSFELLSITDKKLNPSFHSYLADNNTTELENTEDDPQFRNKKIVQFYGLVRDNFNDAYSFFDTTQPRSYSECWLTITKGLSELTQKKADSKYLIIASDLMEKSDILNTYIECGRSSVQTIAQKLQKVYPVPTDLHGITVYIVYQPKDRNDDSRFNKMFEVYKSLLGSNGAILKAQATNTIYN